MSVYAAEDLPCGDCVGCTNRPRYDDDDDACGDESAGHVIGTVTGWIHVSGATSSDRSLPIRWWVGHEPRDLVVRGTAHPRYSRDDSAPPLLRGAQHTAWRIGFLAEAGAIVFLSTDNTVDILASPDALAGLLVPNRWTKLAFEISIDRISCWVDGLEVSSLAISPMRSSRSFVWRFCSSLHESAPETTTAGLPSDETLAQWQWWKSLPASEAVVRAAPLDTLPAPPPSDPTHPSQRVQPFQSLLSALAYDRAEADHRFPVDPRNLPAPDTVLRHDAFPDTAVTRCLVCHDCGPTVYQDDASVSIAWEGECPRAGRTYAFAHWAHCDAWVTFSHAVLSVPPVGWTAAAHTHGVRSIGTLLLEWDTGRVGLEFLLGGDRGATHRARMARGLARLAQRRGFDGYLLNIETTWEDAVKMQELCEFVALLRSELTATLGSDRALCLWYDAITKDGTLRWQNRLTDQNAPFWDAADGMFLNYHWKEAHPSESVAFAGRDRGPSLWFGIDVWGRGTFGGGGYHSVDAARVISAAGASVALFAPGWTLEHEYSRWEPHLRRAAENALFDGWTRDDMVAFQTVAEHDTWVDLRARLPDESAPSARVEVMLEEVSSDWTVALWDAERDSCLHEMCAGSESTVSLGIIDIEETPWLCITAASPCLGHLRIQSRQYTVECERSLGAELGVRAWPHRWPLATSFCEGLGTSGFWRRGRRLSRKAWTDLSLTHLLPAWSGGSLPAEAPVAWVATGLCHAEPAWDGGSVWRAAMSFHPGSSAVFHQQVPLAPLQVCIESDSVRGRVIYRAKDASSGTTSFSVQPILSGNEEAGWTGRVCDSSSAGDDWRVTEVEWSFSHPVNLSRLGLQFDGVTPEQGMRLTVDIGSVQLWRPGVDSDPEEEEDDVAQVECSPSTWEGRPVITWDPLPSARGYDVWAVSDDSRRWVTRVGGGRCVALAPPEDTYIATPVFS